jgi:hypothetical protein
MLIVETRRRWVSGLAITLTALVSLFGFWRLSPGATFLIALLGLVALIIFFWVAGKESHHKPPNRPLAKRPRLQNDRLV